MILIFSAFGPTASYPDQEMMRKTLSAFIGSVVEQTDRGFRLFLTGHDKPEFVQSGSVLWHSLSCDQEQEATLIPETLPKSVRDGISYQPAPPKGKMEDMSRKTRHGVIQAALWAYKNGFEQFWMVRMDSDDLLAADAVRTIHELDGQGIRAVFNRTCHMFDAKTKKIAVHHYPYSNTPNFLKFRINDDGTLTPDWLYLCTNHTLFPGNVRRDGISCREADFIYCIVTNTGNSISGRPALCDVKRTKEIPLTKDLVERYGIEKLI